MNETDIKNLILEIVQERQGCKATEIPPELALRVRSHHKMLGMLELFRTGPSLVEMIEDLVSQGHLVELTYELLDMPEKTKMFLLPVGTRAWLRFWGQKL